MATKTETIKLNQYEGSDYVKMADFNNDNLLIDKAFKEDRAKMKTLEESLGGISTSASGTSYTDTTTQLGATNVQKAIEALATKVKALETELTGQTTRLSNINTELETEIGNPI